MTSTRISCRETCLVLKGARGRRNVQSYIERNAANRLSLVRIVMTPILTVVVWLSDLLS